MSETQLAVQSMNESIAARATEITRPSRIEEHPAWLTISQLPVLLTVQFRLNRMRVRDLLRLDTGQVLESSVSQTNDVPISVGERRLGWGEFEVFGEQIGVRVTQLL